MRTKLGQYLRKTVGLLFDLPRRQLPADDIFRRVGDSAIPATLMQTWEVNSFGRRHFKSLVAFREMNRDIFFEFYDRERRDGFMRSFKDQAISNLYFDSRFTPMAVDIFRYAYLWEKGGYYCDISMRTSRPIRSLHSVKATAAITFENNNFEAEVQPSMISRLPHPNHKMAIWMFGFQPRHAILGCVLEQIKQESAHYRGLEFHIPKAGIISLTGPEAFTRAVIRYLSERPDPTVEFVGIDFNGAGLVSTGAGFRHLDFPTYAKVRNETLFLSDDPKSAQRPSR